MKALSEPAEINDADPMVRRVLAPGTARGRLMRSVKSVAAALFLVLSQQASAADLVASWRALPKEDKFLYANVAAVAAVTTWGIVNWDYFKNSPRADSEGWFGRDTDDGGADKLGHLWVAHTMTHALGALYRSWGYVDKEAGRLGALSAVGVTTLMEVGDSMSSKYGFSYEDALMNLAGAGMGYLLWTRPDLARWIDFRAEWRPNTGSSDPFTDYENLRYLVAVKLEAVESLRTTPLRFVELNVGYYARGYNSPRIEGRERNLYVGVGLNLSQLIREAGHPRVGRVFNFLQVPYTYVSARTNLND